MKTKKELKMNDEEMWDLAEIADAINGFLWMIAHSNGGMIKIYAESLKAFDPAKDGLNLSTDETTGDVIIKTERID